MVTGKGDTIHIPNLSNLTATSKSANVQVTLQAPTESVTNISIDQHYESSFLVEDILKVQSNFDLNSHRVILWKQSKLLNPNRSYINWC